MYEYAAEVTKIIDGDTIRLRVDVGFRMTTEQNFRLYGIDTPELRSRDEDERKRAQLAKARLAELCPIGSKVFVKTHKADKYGRWLAEVSTGEGTAIEYGIATANSILVHEGHAKEYFGGKR